MAENGPVIILSATAIAKQPWPAWVFGMNGRGAEEHTFPGGNEILPLCKIQPKTHIETDRHMDPVQVSANEKQINHTPEECAASSYNFAGMVEHTNQGFQLSIMAYLPVTPLLEAGP